MASFLKDLQRHIPKGGQMELENYDFNSLLELTLNLNNQRKKTKQKILVMEDDPELEYLIEKVLKNINPSIQLDWAVSTEAGLTNLMKTLKDTDHPHYDLIISDIFLEGESTGVDFWRICREHFPCTPFIMTSSLSVEQFTSMAGKKARKPAYLKKPFSLYVCENLCKKMLKQN